MKPKIIIFGGLLLSTMLGMPANAQQRYCVVDERTEDRIVCGRLATKREIEYGNSRRNERRRERDFDYGWNNPRDLDNVYRQIDGIYRQVLGRRADDRSLRGYAERVANGNWDLRRVREELANSQEAREKINQLYREILGRNADGNGLRGYQDALARGSTLEDVRRSLINSEEARRRR